MKNLIIVAVVLCLSLLFISNSYGVNADTQMILREIDGVSSNIHELSVKNDLVNVRIDGILVQIVDMQKEILATNAKYEIEINDVRSQNKYGGLVWGLLGGAGGTGILGGTGIVIAKRKNNSNGRKSTS